MRVATVLEHETHRAAKALAGGLDERIARGLVARHYSRFREPGRTMPATQELEALTGLLLAAWQGGYQAGLDAPAFLKTTRPAEAAPEFPPNRVITEGDVGLQGSAWPFWAWLLAVGAAGLLVGLAAWLVPAGGR